MADDGRFLALTAVGIVPAAQVKDCGMERLLSPSFFSLSILHTPRRRIIPGLEIGKL